MPCVPGTCVALYGPYDGSGEGRLSTTCGKVLRVDGLALVRLGDAGWFWELDVAVIHE